MEVEFLDFASKAEEVGVSEAVIRGRVLSGSMQSFAYVHRAYVMASQRNFLPAWTYEEFPFLRWTDHGSVLKSSDDYYYRGNSSPEYTITGWMGMPRNVAAQILISGRMSIVGEWIYAVDGAFEKGIALIVDRDNLGDSQVIEAAHLYIPSESPTTEAPSLSPYREANLLRIIAALREILLDKDGGGFPSQARIIDLLSDRFEGEKGLSKRNLEDVFADGNRIFNTRRE